MARLQRTKLAAVVAALAALALPKSAGAIIDMRNANYSVEFVDIQEADHSFDFTRTYNSRCANQGFLGFGWGTPFDTRLKWQKDGSVSVAYIGCGTAATYRANPEAQLALGRLGIKPEELGDALANRPEALRGEKITLTNEALTGKLPGGLILSDKGVISDDGLLAFTRDGRATLIEGFSLQYDERKLLVKATDGDITLDFKRPEAGTLLMTYSKMPTVTVVYKIDEKGDLRSATNQWKNTYTYDYTGLHDLSVAAWPDGTNVAVLYDTRHDWVTMFKDRANCVEQYVYTQKEDGSENRSEVFKTCPNGTTAHSYYVYKYAPAKATGARFLASIEVIQDNGGDKLERTTTFYDENGRLTKQVKGETARAEKETNRISTQHAQSETSFFLDETMQILPEPVLVVADVDAAHDHIIGGFVLSHGGDRSQLKNKNPALLIEDRYRIDEKYKGFFQLREHFVLADGVAALAAGSDDGVSMAGGKLTGVRFKGVVYRLETDKSGTLTVFGPELGDKGKTMAELASKTPRELSEKVNTAIDYGSRRQRLIVDLQ